ncbi:hypothetical protein COC42_10675 [Sphingomonas spermidinifaciens]|uniref:DUF5666 domain-containing protein n=1 Tax=Sphingomonas spermidinifaciens TaxID=1141889 RepID=A0A2A4B1N4_9SPHN|nr:DUF6152 family protein [Sphingomonas spermidinifaciens]PCD01957.1 hypothetical protein COC42_10675 [Sphingomonas spermidinifaciens]
MFRSFVAAAVLVAAPVAAVAHHGWSAYDETKPITVGGPLKNVVWGNPHGTAKISYQKKDWDVVLAPTSRMTARGLNADAISKGQRVTLTGYARRDGTAEMRIERITVGKTTVELR